jgi:predicted metal-dependent phosphoesterase TrpH
MEALAKRLVTANAENILRRYGSEFPADHLTWQDFANEAREDLILAIRTMIEHLDTITVPAPYIYRSRSAGGKAVRVDSVPLIFAAHLRALADSIEKSATHA